jgi:hypothetical protein
VGVNLAEFDAETTDLDLVVRSSGALDGTVGVVTPKVSRTVHPVPHSLPPRLPLRISRLDRVFTLNTGTEPVLDELLSRRIGELEVTLSETARANVNLADFADGADLVLVLSVDDEELNVDHTLTGRHDVLAGLEEDGVLRERRDGEVRDGALCLGSTEHVDDAAVLGELLETGAVALGEDVADEEGVKEGGNEAARLSREELTHSYGRVRWSDFRRRKRRRRKLTHRE